MIVHSNQLELLARSLEMTRRYIAFKQYLRGKNTTILQHILENELKWTDSDLIEDSLVAVMQPQHLKVIYNLFPYHFSHDVLHLCVWSKVRIYADENSPEGDISAETRQVISRYVNDQFTVPLELDAEDVCWFKNWTSLQSVKAISHIHVLLRGVLRQVVNELFMIENGDAGKL